MTANFTDLKDQWTAYAQSLRLWVVQVLVWLAEVTKSRELRLRARYELRFLRREVRQILITRFAIEMCENPLKPQKRRAHRGELIVHRRRFYRYVLRGARLRTFEDAKHVLEHLDAFVARCVAHYRSGMKALRARVIVDDAARASRVSRYAEIPDT